MFALALSIFFAVLASVARALEIMASLRLGVFCLRRIAVDLTALTNASLACLLATARVVHLSTSFVKECSWWCFVVRHAVPDFKC